MTTPPSPPGTVLEFKDTPLRPVAGLGSDLKKMLSDAVQLLENRQVAEFILTVYPLAELAELSERKAFENLLARLNSRPEMIAAMIRDLRDAATATPAIRDNEAMITLPPLVPGDPERKFRFQLVQGNWRLFDGNAESREEYRQLIKGNIPAVTTPGVKGILLLTRDGENWRMNAPPTTEPLN